VGRSEGSEERVSKGARWNSGSFMITICPRYRKREGGVVETVLGQSQIVLATCHSAGGRQLYKHTFDVVIIDEATQAMEAVRRFRISSCSVSDNRLSGLLDSDFESQEVGSCG
jgi:DNA polymerase alpha-associated DNA helicase A